MGISLVKNFLYVYSPVRIYNSYNEETTNFFIGISVSLGILNF